MPFGQTRGVVPGGSDGTVGVLGVTGVHGLMLGAGLTILLAPAEGLLSNGAGPSRLGGVPTALGVAAGTAGFEPNTLGGVPVTVLFIGGKALFGTVLLAVPGIVDPAPAAVWPIATVDMAKSATAMKDANFVPSIANLLSK